MYHGCEYTFIEVSFTNKRHKIGQKGKLRKITLCVDSAGITNKRISIGKPYKSSVALYSSIFQIVI